MILPLPNTIGGTGVAPRTIEYLHNMYSINGVAVAREPFRASRDYSDGNGGSDSADYFPRGQAVSANGDTLYSVYGTGVYKRTQTVSMLLLTGAISSINISGYGSREVSMAVGFTGIAIATGDGNYFLDYATETVTELTDPDLPQCVNVVYLRGRYVWCARDGESIWFSEVNDAGNIGSLSFFDSESSTDPNSGLAVIGNDLYVLGDRTIERFVGTESATIPFKHVPNSVLPIGYVGGIIRFSDKIVFLGKRDGGQRGIYELSNGRLVKISNQAVDELINDSPYFGLPYAYILGRTVGQSWSSYGRDVISFGFPAVTTTGNTPSLSIAGVYDGGMVNWSFISNDMFLSQDGSWGTDGFDVLGERALHMLYAVRYGDEWFFQAGRSYALAGEYVIDSDRVEITDELHPTGGANAPISRGFRVAIRDAEEEAISLSSIEPVFSKGGATPDSDDEINFNVSTTGLADEWSTTKTYPLLGMGDKGKARLSPTGGCVTGEGFIGLIVETRSKTPVTFEKVIVK